MNQRQEHHLPSRLRHPSWPPSLTIGLAFTLAWGTTSATAGTGPDLLEQYIEMDLKQLMQITVTSVAKKPQPLADTAAAVFVITQEDIRKSGATTIADALALAPGIHVAQVSASKWSVSARGFTGLASNKLLVLIDGRSVYSPAYSGTFWDMQHTLLADIDRIEVIRGPGGTILGANAVNGVINIITKNAADTTGTILEAGTGSHERAHLAGRIGGQLTDNAAGRFYLTATDRDSFQLHTGGTDSKDDWTNYQAGFRLDSTATTSSSWSLHGDLFRNEGDELFFPYWQPGPPFLSMAEIGWSSEGANLTGTYVKSIAAGQQLKFQAYYDYNGRDEKALVFAFHTLDFDLQYDLEASDRHALTFGTGYRYISSDFDQTFQFGGPDENYQLLSGFVQDRVTLVNERLFLTGGLKWEHNDFTGNEWQPSASLLYTPRDNHSLWLAISRAVRTPSAIEDEGRLVFSSFPPPYGPGVITTVGSPDFESEEVIAYEAGYRWQPTEEISADFSIFYNDYSDLYTFLSASGGLDQQFENALEARSYGFEAAVKWRPVKNLAIDLTYSFLDFDFTGSIHDLGFSFLDFAFSGSAADNSIIAQVIESTAPSHHASLHGSWDITPTLQFNSWLRYQSDTEMLDAGTLFSTTTSIDAFISVDANLRWRPTENLEVSLIGQNLFNNCQLHYAAESLSPAIEIERELFLKLSYSF